MSPLPGKSWRVFVMTESGLASVDLATSDGHAFEYVKSEAGENEVVIRLRLMDLTEKKASA